MGGPHPKPREVLDYLENEAHDSITFDPKREWEPQVGELIEELLQDRLNRYRTRIGPVLTRIKQDPDYKNLASVLPKTRKLQYKDRMLLFLDGSGKTLVKFEISDGLEEMCTEMRERERSLCFRRTRRTLEVELGGLSGQEDIFRLSGGEDDGTGGRRFGRGYRRNREYEDQQAARRQRDAQDAEAGRGGSHEGHGARRETRIPVTPAYMRAALEDPESAEANRKFFEDLKSDRQSMLTRLVQSDVAEQNVPTRVPPQLQGVGKDEFDEVWRSMDGNDPVDELMRFDPDPASGYTINPFKQLGWNHETLRKLMQEAGTGRLFFQKIAQKLYNDRYEQFKKDLQSQGVPEPVLDLLDKDVFVLWRPFKRKDDDLVKTYRRLARILERVEAVKDPKKVPEDLKEIYPHREKLKYTVSVLGDYIAYATHLLNLLNKLVYNPARYRSDARAGMMEFSQDNTKKDKERNRVVIALHDVFDIGSPERPQIYETKWDGFRAKDTGRVVFDDLNGNTATLNTDWFKEDGWFERYISRETAYHGVYEAATSISKDAGYREVISENSARDNLNHLLQLGIAAYDALRVDPPLEKIIREMEEAGVRTWGSRIIHFSGVPREDMQGLYRALMLKSLQDIGRGSPLVEKWRKRLIRIGAVINQKQKAEQQRSREAHEFREARFKLRLSETQARDIVDALRRIEGPNKFSEMQLQQIKDSLVFGGAIAVSTTGAVGGALGAHLVFENGVSLDIAAAVPVGGGLGVGAAVGKRFELTKNVEVSISLGTGLYWSAAGPPFGVPVGVSARVTKKFDSIDAYVEAGGGFLIGPMVPTAFVGAGLDFAKTKEKYERKLEKKEIEFHIDELDRNRSGAYEMVKANPTKYPEMAAIIERIESVAELQGTGQNEEARRAVFAGCYDVFKDSMQEQTMREVQWPRFVPSAIGVGLAMVGPIPVPFVYVKFPFMRRELIYRIHSDEQDTTAVTDVALRRSLQGRFQQPEIQTKTKELQVKAEIAIDDRGQKVLRKYSEMKLDFTKADKFEELKEELGVNARIAIEKFTEGNMELIELDPQEANGNIEVYLDPAIRDDVILVYHQNRLYMSVRNNKAIVVRREDITFPFEERGEVERTRILITNRPGISIDAVRRQSKWFLRKYPDREWQPSKGLAHRGADEEQSPSNVKTLDGFRTFWRGTSSEREARTEVQVDYKGRQKAYDDLRRAVSLPDGLKTRDSELGKALDAFKKDKARMLRFKEYSTEGIKYIRPGKLGWTAGNWQADLPRLVGWLKTEFQTLMTPADGSRPEALNAEEINLVLFQLTIESFHDLEHAKKIQDKYLKILREFQKQILETSIGKYFKEKLYKNDPAKADAKTKEAVAFIMARMEKIDITKPGSKLEADVLFATIVGTDRITGFRSLYNYRDERVYGMLDRDKLHPEASGIEGDIAKFWLEMLSPYESGLIPEADKPLPNDISEKVYKNLDSPFFIKLLPVIAVVLTQAEMAALADIYKRRPTRPAINESNREMFRKLFALADKVRAAELNGGQPSEIPINDEFSIVIIKSNISMGVYKKCGNITGIVGEEFALKQTTKTRPKYYYAGYAEGSIDTRVQFASRTFSAVLGGGVPVVSEEHRIPTPQKPPEKSPPPPQPAEGAGSAPAIGAGIDTPEPSQGLGGGAS